MKTLACVGLALAAPIAFTCCISYAQRPMTLTGENAIIVWDEANKTEHFIRSAHFDGQAENFGFILPVPSAPGAIEVADVRAFQTLESMSPISRILASGRGHSLGSGGSKGVEVVEQKMVGDYQATVLKATDADAMAGWLSTNGHQMRPAMKPWIKTYTDKGWFFVAFRYEGQKGPTATNAVRVSFRADRPHYPYRMPSDTFAANHHRKLQLYFVTKGAVKGTYSSGKPWETAAAWTSEIEPINREILEDQLGAPGKKLLLGPGLTITRFENSPKATNYADDLTFLPDNRSPKARIGFEAGKVGFLR